MQVRFAEIYQRHLSWFCISLHTQDEYRKYVSTYANSVAAGGILIVKQYFQMVGPYHDNFLSC